MSAKSNAININNIKQNARELIPALSFLFLALCSPTKVLANTQELSIAAFNERMEAQKNEQYHNFERAWFSFLKGETAQAPNPHPAAWVRKATEEYLMTTGGLKAEFAKASRQNNYGFTFTRPVDDPDRKASFHRSYKSIFMDIDRMQANEWLIIFIHEVAHSLDSELRDAIPIYNEDKFISVLVNYGKDNVRLNQLTQENRDRLDAWLVAGLNRGFLAEYRAWLLTETIYEEGRRQGIFSEVDWLENLQSTKPQGQNMATHILRHLSPSWVDPREGIFEYSFIQEALKDLRKKIYAQPDTIKLGAIGKILSGKFSQTTNQRF